MEDADKHGWAIDKIVIPFTSIILQDVYYIKTHSKDFTSAGGINLKVRFTRRLSMDSQKNAVRWISLQKYYSMAKFISDEFVQCKQSKVGHSCSFSTWKLSAWQWQAKVIQWHPWKNRRLYWQVHDEHATRVLGPSVSRTIVSLTLSDIVTSVGWVDNRTYPCHADHLFEGRRWWSLLHF